MDGMTPNPTTPQGTPETPKERRERLLFDAKQSALELDDLESTLIAVGGPEGSGEAVAYAAGHIRNLLEELAADRRRLEAELAVARMRLAALEVERWDDFSKDDPQSWPLYVHKWLEAELADLLKAYDELIYAVATKHEGETRHQTALRYIREAESRPSGGPSVAALTAGEETP